MLTERKRALLSYMIEVYIANAEPVASQLLVDKYHLEVSPATVRNDMVELEQEGYVSQPHTSAGRIPTLKGFSAYIEPLRVKPPDVPKKLERILAQVIEQEQDQEIRLRQLARRVAEMADSAVVMQLGPDSTYYTGLVSLFGQPEFADQGLVCSFSRLLDRLEDALGKACHLWEGERPDVLMGESNPFGEHAVFVGTPIGEETLFGILGPVRMNYKRNLGIIAWIYQHAGEEKFGNEVLEIKI